MKKLLLLLAACASANAAEYFVATNGSSGNDGLTEGAPWPFQYAMNQLVPGMTVTLLDGLYTNYCLIDSKNVATVRAKNKWKAVLGNGTDTNNWSGYQFIVYGNSNTFDGLCISNSISAGMGLIGVSNTVKNCWIVNNFALGLDASSPNSSNNVFERNLIELSGYGLWNGINGQRWHGLYLSGPNNIIRNNVIRNNAGYGIHLSTSYDNVHMNNNRIYQNLTYGHVNFYGCVVSATDEVGALEGTNYIYGNTFIDGLFLSAGAAYVTNNIILNGGTNSARNITLYGGNVPFLSNNYNLSTISFNNDDGVVQGANDVITNAVRFANTNNGLFWLQSTSPARNKAKTTVYALMNFFGNAQSSASDIGAFQYDARYAADVRVLDPSPVAGANYWQVLATGSLSIGAATITNLRVQ